MARAINETGKVHGRLTKAVKKDYDVKYRAALRARGLCINGCHQPINHERSRSYCGTCLDAKGDRITTDTASAEHWGSVVNVAHRQTVWLIVHRTR